MLSPLPSMFLGSKQARRRIKRISKHAKTLSGMAACGTSFYRGGSKREIDSPPIDADMSSAAQAWNRNDARAAKALSLRGQSENDLMRKAHREAARLLYEERNKDAATSSEIYVDLHGLHPEEAIEFLEAALVEQQKSGRPVYVITGTGHHSKGGKDKVGKTIRGWLNEWKYAWREFSVPGDSVGGILGVDPKSFDRGLVEERRAEGAAGEEKREEVIGGKIRLVKEVPEAARGKVG